MEHGSSFRPKIRFQNHNPVIIFHRIFKNPDLFKNEAKIEWSRINGSSSENGAEMRGRMRDELVSKSASIANSVEKSFFFQ
jgi:hypothetical protein